MSMEVKTEVRTNEEKAEPELRKVKNRKEQNSQDETEIITYCAKGWALVSRDASGPDAVAL